MLLAERAAARLKQLYALIHLTTETPEQEAKRKEERDRDAQSEDTMVFLRAGA